MAAPDYSKDKPVADFCRLLLSTLEEKPIGHLRSFKHGEGYDEAVAVVTKLCRNQAEPFRTEKGDYVLRDIATGETLTYGFFDTLEEAEAAADRVRYPPIDVRRALDTMAVGGEPCAYPGCQSPRSAPAHRAMLEVHGTRYGFAQTLQSHPFRRSGPYYVAGAMPRPGQSITSPITGWEVRRDGKEVSREFVHPEEAENEATRLNEEAFMGENAPIDSTPLNQQLMVAPLVRAYVEERTHTGPEGTHTEVVRGIETEPVEVTYEPCPGCGREPGTFKNPPSHKRAGCTTCGGQGFVRKGESPAIPMKDVLDTIAGDVVDREQFEYTHHGHNVVDYGASIECRSCGSPMFWVKGERRQ
jgi:hypothetical protein